MPDLPATQSKELSSEEADARAERCFAIDQSIKACLASGRSAMWELAKRLHEFDEENGWTALGYESQSEWLADPEIGMSRAQFFRLVGQYRELVIQRQLPADKVAELDTSKVEIVLPRVKAGSVTLTDALEDVKTLGKQDLRKKYLSRPDPADAQPLDDAIGPPGGTPPIATPDAPPEPNSGDDDPVWAKEDDDDPVIEGDGTEVSSEPVDEDDDVAAGEPVPDPGPAAIEVLDWIKKGLVREASPAIRRHALLECQKFICGLYPQLAELEA
jgi:hypothetical protein